MSGAEERRKVMGGAQLRKLRADLALSQVAMAAELGISTSYLNLVERNQRPVTAQLLLRLSETYAIDIHAFTRTEGGQATAELEEILTDPLLKPLGVPRAELRAAQEQAPTLLAALRRLHGAYLGLSELRADGPPGERGAPGGAEAGEAVERVRAILEARGNHFPELEAAAERIGTDFPAEDGPAPERSAGLARRLRQHHRVRVVVLPQGELGVTLRHYDRHRRRLLLSERLEPPSRAFQTALQVGLLEAGDALDAAMTGIEPPEEAALPAPARRLARVALSNYLAAALLMPYAPFLAAAQDVAYDVDVLAARFGTSWEQAAHRLTTLGRPSARGVPFFLVRVDQAGNVTKRFSAGAFPFSRLGGTCPRWSLHEAARLPGRVLRQVVALDGRTWLTVARAAPRMAGPWGEPETLHAIALGCEIRHAPQLVYGRDLKGVAPTEIGITCRLCDRPHCASRAAPSARLGIEVMEATRGMSPFGA